MDKFHQPQAAVLVQAHVDRTGVDVDVRTRDCVCVCVRIYLRPRYYTLFQVRRPMSTNTFSKPLFVSGKPLVFHYQCLSCHLCLLQ